MKPGLNVSMNLNKVITCKKRKRKFLSNSLYKVTKEFINDEIPENALKFQINQAESPNKSTNTSVKDYKADISK